MPGVRSSRPNTADSCSGNRWKGGKACRIFEPAEGDVENEADHEKYIEFFIDAGERFRNAISAVNGASL